VIKINNIKYFKYAKIKNSTKKCPASKRQQRKFIKENIQLRPRLIIFLVVHKKA